jgi:choice-of-anchor A domain-containing protein
VLSGLAPNTTYYFRVSATNAAGATDGAELSFTTLANPIQVTDFNLFAIEKLEYTSGSIQGRVAAGGNATLKSVSEGAGLPNSNGTRDDLIVGGNLSFTSGTVQNGNIVYGGTISLKNVTIQHGTARKVADPLSIAATRSYVAGVAASWAALPANGTTTVELVGSKTKTAKITLSGSDPVRNIFTLAGADLAKANNLKISAPAGSIVIVNIDGAMNSMQSFGTTLSGVDSQHIVYNFHRATSLTIKSLAVQGTVWAPLADVSFSSGNVSGTLLAKSFKGSSGSFRMAPFAGPLP